MMSKSSGGVKGRAGTAADRSTGDLVRGEPVMAWIKASFDSVCVSRKCRVIEERLRNRI